MNNHDHCNHRHLHHHRSRQRRCHLSDGTWEGGGRRLRNGSRSHRSLRIYNDDLNYGDIILLNNADNADDFERDVNDIDYDGNDGDDGDDVDVFDSGSHDYDDESH